MRVQQTDQILKEAKVARHTARKQESDLTFFERMKRAITNLFHRD